MQYGIPETLQALGMPERLIRGRNDREIIVLYRSINGVGNGSHTRNASADYYLARYVVRLIQEKPKAFENWLKKRNKTYRLGLGRTVAQFISSLFLSVFRPCANAPENVTAFNDFTFDELNEFVEYGVLRQEELRDFAVYRSGDRLYSADGADIGAAKGALKPVDRRKKEEYKKKEKLRKKRQKENKSRQLQLAKAILEEKASSRLEENKEAAIV